MSDDAGRRKIGVTLDPDLADAIEQEAHREHSSASAVIRRVVADWARQVAEHPAARLSAAIALCAVPLAFSTVLAGSAA